MYYRGEFYVVLGLGLHIQLPVIDFGIQVVGKLRQAVVCVYCLCTKMSCVLPILLPLPRVGIRAMYQAQCQPGLE